MGVGRGDNAAAAGIELGWTGRYANALRRRYGVFAANSAAKLGLNLTSSRIGLGRMGRAGGRGAGRAGWHR